MKQLIKDVLEDVADSQPNLNSEAARENIATSIISVIKSKGSYVEFTDTEIDEQKMKDSWVCSICGNPTYDVDYDYIGSGTNHLGCELELEMTDDELKLPADMKLKNPVGPRSDKRLTSDRRKTDRRETVRTLDEDVRREKNYSQKKHEEKVFGHDQGGSYEYAEDIDEQAFAQGRVSSKDDLQKQAYMEMTSDGLPPGGDSQAVLESHKLAEEIVEAQEGTWIYESPDGGKTVFRRPFSDYDPKNKEEIDFKTKEPTGRKFTDYPFVEDVQIDGC